MGWIVLDQSDAAEMRCYPEFLRAVHEIIGHALVIFVARVDVRCVQ